MHLSETERQEMTEQTILTVVSAVVASMGGVIAFLYRQISEQAKAVQEKLTDCEDDREDLWRFLLTKFPSDEVLKTKTTKR